MKKFIILTMILSIFNLGLPLTGMAAEQEFSNISNPTEQPTEEGPKVTSLFNSGVITAAVAVLGFVALAASVDSGDATPSSTTVPVVHH